jgi:hypothetical protein
MGKDYAGVCGITAREMQAYFQPELKALAAEFQMSNEEVWVKMEREYDGYHFREGSEGVFNLFSVLNTFAELKFTHEWFRTGPQRSSTPFFRTANWKREKASRSIVLCK